MIQVKRLKPAYRSLGLIVGAQERWAGILLYTANNIKRGLNGQDKKVTR